ncbi:unnamed protein product [Pieris macdunnoughi]|uniref:Uncharacterized protein n=1 Tax=Pieris macdunnoughi TaxID=345717 RepID=A0A821R7R2_9NEOP|nr:unnamed protein product [Pieris macdunnoughi]
MSNIPLVRRAIVGASLAHTPVEMQLVNQVQEDQWTPAALERAGSTLKALNRMAKRPPVNILFEDVCYTVSSKKVELLLHTSNSRGVLALSSPLPVTYSLVPSFPLHTCNE